MNSEREAVFEHRWKDAGASDAEMQTVSAAFGVDAHADLPQDVALMRIRNAAQQRIAANAHPARGTIRAWHLGWVVPATLAAGFMLATSMPATQPTSVVRAIVPPPTNAVATVHEQIDGANVSAPSQDSPAQNGRTAHVVLPNANVTLFDGARLTSFEDGSYSVSGGRAEFDVRIRSPDAAPVVVHAGDLRIETIAARYVTDVAAGQGAIRVLRGTTDVIEQNRPSLRLHQSSGSFPVGRHVSLRDAVATTSASESVRAATPSRKKQMRTERHTNVELEADAAPALPRDDLPPPIEDHPESLMAEISIYRAALTDLQRKHFSSGAAGFRAYLSAHPDGVLVNEARLGLVDALAHGTQLDEAEREIVSWLADYSTHARRAQVEDLLLEIRRKKTEGSKGTSEY